MERHEEARGNAEAEVLADRPPPTTSLPSGLVTFVLTDIEGSTRLMRRLGEAYEPVLERHRQLLRSAWAMHDGHEVDVEGDGGLIAFAEPLSAVRACAEAQRLLAVEPWGPDVEVRVRMGIHRGLASPRGHNYVALAVHQLARVMACAHGGQVLLTDDVAEHLPIDDQLRLVPMGHYRIRDFDTPVRIHQLGGSGLAGSFPALRALPADGHNLVRPRTSFVGRDDAVDSVLACIGPRTLVSLVGPGGVGKSRLAVEVGFIAASAWADGVWLVDLAPLAGGELVPAAVATALGVRAGATDPLHEVVEHLRSRSALVVVDNCEHVVDACAEVVTSILAAPAVGVLVTSREPLRIPGEVIWRVPPLPIPRAGGPEAEEVASPSVQLFVARAASVRPSFSLDDGNASAVTDICRKLDGLPLALEMAAALVSVQSPSEILAGLEDRFRFLRSPERDVDDRHRTMEAMLGWSHRLLSTDERAALRRLSLLPAGFTIDVAKVAVADGATASDDVPLLVWSLVDKSLATADLSANDTRYRLLETVRAFANRHLNDSGEATAVASRLATWFLEEAGPWGTLDRRWIGLVGVELDNLRAVVTMLGDNDVESAQQLAASIGQYHDASGSYRQGASELARYARTLTAATTSRIAMLNRLADLQLRFADLSRAETTIAEAERLRDEVGAVPDWDDAGVDRARGDLQNRAGDRRAAEATARRALERNLSVRGRARMWNLVGLATVGEDDATALAAFEEELRAYEELGHEVWIASASGNVAEVALRIGDRAMAARRQRTSLRLGVEQGSTIMVAYSMVVAARLAAGAAAWADALRLGVLADIFLRSSEIILYEDDRRLLDETMRRARAEVGDEAAAAITAEVSDFDLVTAAAMAAEIFEPDGA